MIRKFCDRCGVECKSLFDIRVPLENHGHGSYSTKDMAVCEKCNKIHESILETLTEMRFSMYENLFFKGGAKNDL
ncbi:MAG: hypothetical protein J6D20_07455 [Clostridia bacterium]|nr:hypothetical protein [Clostridia bacterium]